MPNDLDIKALKPPMNITHVTSLAGMDEVVDWLLGHPEFGLDVETPPLKTFFVRRCRTIQVGDKERQFVIDLLAIAESRDALLDCQGQYGANLSKSPAVGAVIDKLTPFLCSDLWLKVGVNLGFEYMTLYWNFGVRIWNLFCCQLAERVIEAGRHTLKDFGFFSMEEMMLRYFNTQINKDLQQTFDTETPLTQDQIEYAALDVRFPFSIKAKQVAIAAKAGLVRTFRIEHECIGAFVEMHVHGERLDVAKWKANTAEAEAKRDAALAWLDSIFLPLVGSKDIVITDEEIEASTAKWKLLNEVTDEELALKTSLKQARKVNPELINSLELKLEAKIKERIAQKEILKEETAVLKRHRSAINKLKEKCEGKALINYGSNAQLHKALIANFPALKKLASTNDDDMKAFEHLDVIKAIREWREWDKRVKTYGLTWVTEWTTHPCAEEGWMSPYTHRIHSTTNQLLAETGRTSSDNPNSQNLPRDPKVRECFIADDGYLYITIDMSGAELRILAELANAQTWIDAFLRDEDVHSVCTEIFYKEEWKANALPDCKYFKLHTAETVKKNPFCVIGTPMRRKCKCPDHNARRNATKPVNFGLPYGAVATTIAKKENLPLELVEQAFALHEKNFPDIWAYLAQSELSAKNTNQSFTMFGRRRLLPAPTTERARQQFIDRYPDSLEYPKHVKEKNIAAYVEKHGKNPPKEEKFWLTHREPTQKEITKSFIAISRGIGRQGKNHEVQGTNADIIKVALGSGKSPQGRPYLFHTLPLLGAKLVKMVHDELVIMAPIANAERVAKLVGIAFRTAAAEVMKKIIMENEYNIGPCWSK